MVSLFKKYCQICGMETSKDKNLVRFGKSFCSEEHVQEYVKEQKKVENLERRMTVSNNIKTRSSGGCC